MKNAGMAKRGIVSLLFGAFVLTALLGGCASASVKPAEEPEQQEEAVENVENTESQKAMGSWEVSTEEAPALSAEEEEIFLAATKGLEGADFHPVALLASQLVSGKNYAYLCEGKPVSSDADSAWFMIVVYQDLEGNTIVARVQEIRVDMMRTLQGAPVGALLGGWKVHEQAARTLSPEESDKAFAQATKGYEDVALTPIATLATQVVAGTNYRILCEGVPADNESGDHLLYVVDVYVDLQGKAELSNVSQLEFLSYVSPSA